MLILPMETQAHMEMAQREIQEQRTKELVEEITEEEFLKNLYLFMKNRDTPIERIPNLGFKQIDLFLMFKVVREMGGYHQVTVQQLWKQVYNSLGGNPRSTSAATCTRRHYEKLLLQYECHQTGILVNVLPRNQPKLFHYDSFSKEHDGSPRPVKRKLPPIPLLQNPLSLQSHLHESVFPPFPRYHPYYQPSHTVLPPYVPISSPVLTPLSSPAPKPWYPLLTSHLNPTESENEPLKKLRSLANQYMTTSRLTEPLNLSIKEPRRETYSNPASSFSIPLSSKTPKFLNQPSPLYTAHSLQVGRNDGSETQEVDASLGDTSYSYPEKVRESHVDQKAITASGSPTAPTLRTDEGASAMAQKSSSPKTEVTIFSEEERVGSPELREIDVSDILPDLPRENGGKMEIEVPLSVFHKWLKLCGSSVRMHGFTQEEHSEQRKCPDAEGFPINMASNMNRKHQNSSGEAEDLRLLRTNFPGSTQSTGNHQKTSQDHFINYIPQQSDIRKSAASQMDINKSHSSRATHCWDAFDKKTQAPTIPVNIDSSPHTVQQGYTTSISCNEDTVQAGGGESDTGLAAMLLLNSPSNPLLQFTTEEVMKLRRIISRSL
ncbi:hypothetical protein PBY51_023831 [Eleginops maclovinus]|uniref:ARID domain-containing protein n=2 Tax=Eleginops maclovinus TaxID=56733 RepID=A0AAN8AA02_ELEMC|nr:hypothetical protein PBY51_023831 [Eleginops maclovinus]